MTIAEAMAVALACIEDQHGQYTGDLGHKAVAVDCACGMGRAYRALHRELDRLETEKRRPRREAKKSGGRT